MAKSKVKINLKPLKAITSKVTLTNDFLAKVGEIVKTDITIRSRKGIGYDDKPFPSLQDSTIDHREYLETKITTHELFKPEKSNATISGQLIDSIQYIVSVFSKKVTIKPFGQHKPYLKGKQISNQKIMEYLAKKGWSIMGISQKTKDKIAVEYKRFLRRKLR